MKSKSGYSLIEVVIALAILLIITNMLAFVLSYSLRNSRNLSAYNKRLDVIEYISKNIISNCSYDEINNALGNPPGEVTLLLNSSDFNYNKTFSIEELIRVYKSKSNGDVEVILNHTPNIVIDEIKILIKSNTYGSRISNYEIIKKKQ